MKGGSTELTSLNERVARLEETVAALAGQLPTETEGEAATAVQPDLWQDSASIRDLHRASLQALQAYAKEAQSPVVFVATADEQSAASGGPDSVLQLTKAGNIQPLAFLGVAIGHPSRVKIIRLLLLQEECSITELAGVSEAMGGNLYQHLDAIQAANLLYQPGRGRYRLTESGQRVAAVLFWCALQVGAVSLAQQ